MKKVSVKTLLSDYPLGTRFIEDDGFNPPSGIRTIIGSKQDLDTDTDEGESPALLLVYKELYLGATVSEEHGEASQFDTTPCYVLEPADIVKLGPYMSSTIFQHYRETSDAETTIVKLNMPKMEFAPIVELIKDRFQLPEDTPR